MGSQNATFRRQTGVERTCLTRLGRCNPSLLDPFLPLFQVPVPFSNSRPRHVPLMPLHLVEVKIPAGSARIPWLPMRFTTWRKRRRRQGKEGSGWTPSLPRYDPRRGSDDR